MDSRQPKRKLSHFSTRLDTVLENWRRRDFLKTVGSAAAAPNSIVGILSAADDKYAQAIEAYRRYKEAGYSTGPLRDIMFGIVNNGMMPDENGYDISSWYQPSPWMKERPNVPDNIPPNVVVGCMLDETDDSSPADLMNQFSTGDDSARAFNSIPGFANLRDNILQAMIKKFDFKEILKSIQSHYATPNMGVDDQFWCFLHDLMDLSSEFIKKIGIAPQQLERLRHVRHGVGALLRKGLIDKETAQAEMHRIQVGEENAEAYRKQKEQWDREAAEKNEQREKENAEKAEKEKRAKEPEELEQYNVPGDYKAASPMHQWFENRIRTIANLITEDPDIFMEIDASMDTSLEAPPSPEFETPEIDTQELDERDLNSQQSEMEIRQDAEEIADSPDAVDDLSADMEAQEEAERMAQDKMRALEPQIDNINSSLNTIGTSVNQGRAQAMNTGQAFNGLDTELGALKKVLANFERSL